jgi:hypothetical protein
MKTDDKQLKKVRDAGHRVAEAASALIEAFSAFEDAVLAAPGAQWSDSGVDVALLARVQTFAGTPTTSQRLYAESVRRTSRGEKGPRETDMVQEQLGKPGTFPDPAVVGPTYARTHQPGFPGRR